MWARSRGRRKRNARRRSWRRWHGYIELCELIQEMLEVKERTAKGYIRYMREKEIIEKEGDCYVHGQGRV